MTPQTTFANGINPFQGLGALPTKPDQTMQKPAEPAKTKLKDEDYSTTYQPPVLVPPEPAKVEPKRKKDGTYRAQTRHLDPSALTITDDPLPAGRAMPEHKYAPLFAKMKVGQAVRVPTNDVGKVSNALRKYVEVKGLRAKINSTTLYAHPVTRETDVGHGRVWMLAAPAKALKVA